MGQGAPGVGLGGDSRSRTFCECKSALGTTRGRERLSPPLLPIRRRPLASVLYAETQHDVFEVARDAESRIAVPSGGVPDRADHGVVVSACTGRGSVCLQALSGAITHGSPVCGVVA